MDIEDLQGEVFDYMINKQSDFKYLKYMSILHLVHDVKLIGIINVGGRLVNWCRDSSIMNEVSGWL